MRQATRTRPFSLLNTDGRPHPLENALCLITFGCGLIAFVAGLIDSAHLIASIAGAAGGLIGLYSQLISATTAERWFNVLGLGGCFIGLVLGLAQGGFTI
jgi:hypothetical protein